MKWVIVAAIAGAIITALVSIEKDDYQLFDQGAVIHHKADGTRGVVLHCDRYKCNVKTSGHKIMENLWMSYEIKETPNEEKADG